MKNKSVVSIGKCGKYADAKNVLIDILKTIDCLDIFKNKKVLFKVNVGKGKPPATAVSTHPEFVRAMIQIAKCQGAKEICVGDSSAALGHTRQAFKKSGIADIIDSEGVKLINFDASRIIEKKIDGKVLQKIYLPEDIFRADLLVSLPKLKTHPFTLFSGAVKNQMGLIPGAEKCKIHQIAAHIKNFSHGLVDINLAVKFNFAVIDAVIGLEGGGSSTGTAKKAGFIAASKDFIALDAVSSSAIGISPLTVATTKIGGERGLGISNLEDIEVSGGEIKEFFVMFKKARFDFKRIPLIAKIAYKIRAEVISPLVDKRYCVQCRRCEYICPVNAITFNLFPKINHNCLRCYSCYENCPHGAIKLKCKLYLKYLVENKLGERLGY